MKLLLGFYIMWKMGKKEAYHDEIELEDFEYDVINDNWFEE